MANAALQLCSYKLFQLTAGTYNVEQVSKLVAPGPFFEVPAPKLPQTMPLLLAFTHGCCCSPYSGYLRPGRGGDSLLLGAMQQAGSGHSL
jgi:hypothetical protein